MNIRPFEIALIAFFGIAAVIALFYFSMYKAGSSDAPKMYGESVVIWGTFDGKIMNEYLDELSRPVEQKDFRVVSYVEKDKESIGNDLLNAIADGNPPDLVMLSHEDLVTYRSKLLAFTSKNFGGQQMPQARDFRDSYIDGAEIFLLSDGIYGVPFAVDPLVMYWNRDLFSAGGLASPPKTWEGLMSETTKAITRTDSELHISQSAVAMGEYANVKHAKAVLATLFFQAGSSITSENTDGYRVTLNEGSGNTLSPGDAALPFYVQFSIPTQSAYSWNRSRSTDRVEFTNGTLGMYFGMGSERNDLLKENPNLNMDIAPVPQGEGATVKRNYGDFYAFVIPRTSKNAGYAYLAARYMSDGANGKQLAHILGFAPVGRALYAEKQEDPYEAVIYQSGLIARGWLDPSPSRSGDVFREMIERSQRNEARTKSIIVDAVHELEALF